jgi:hypothetical protein
MRIFYAHGTPPGCASQPEATVELTNEQHQALIERFDAFWKNRPCNTCGATSWFVHTRIYELREFRPVSVVSKLPMVVVHCQSCGEIHQFSAVLLGVDITADAVDVIRLSAGGTSNG